MGACLHPHECVGVIATAILYWKYRAELTNDPSLGVNQKMNDSEAACCGAEALGLRLGTTG